MSAMTNAPTSARSGSATGSAPPSAPGSSAPTAAQVILERIRAKRRASRAAAAGAAASHGHASSSSSSSTTTSSPAVPEGGGLTHEERKGPERNTLVEEAAGRVARVTITGQKPNANKQACAAPASTSEKAKPSAQDSARLFRQSQLAKRDRTLLFDLRDRGEPGQPLFGALSAWLLANLPSKTRRSAGVGRIVVLSAARSDADPVRASEAKMRREADALKEWNLLLDKEGNEINMKTFEKLADKHGLSGGKWIAHINSLGVDYVWRRVALALACNKFPASCASASVTPLSDDRDEEEAAKAGGAGDADSGTHVVALWTRDFRDTTAVLAAERALRSACAISLPLAFKPDIFSAVGVYRGNPWGIRPALFTSRIRRDEDQDEDDGAGDAPPVAPPSGSNVVSHISADWKFVVKR